ncbi:MAG: ABC transporter ATP-binding protein [Deltaproteobacteria bacterium]|nr:ABC transporter ATP-binding protein [Deltaproteobacteria bacterium]
METVIETRGLSVRAPLKTILDSVDLDVAKGSVTGLLGENGAGKTTTLRVLLGLMGRSKGTVRVLGMDPARDEYAIKQRVGYVPDEHGYPSWMSIRRLVSFVGGFYDRFSHESVLNDLVRLRLPLGQSIGSLSKGEAAKVAMTLALGHSPELLLLDEPTSGLDPRVRQEMLRLLVERSQTAGMTVLFSSHILSDIAQIADRVAIMSRGNVVCSSSMEDFVTSLVRMSFVWEGDPPAGVAIPGCRRLTLRGREVEAIVPGRLDPDGIARAIGAKSVRVEPLTLDELFVETVSATPLSQPFLK